ncbi:hypothetical protein THAOC_14567, partial [Thalassiosira oceanica]
VREGHGRGAAGHGCGQRWPSAGRPLLGAQACSSARHLVARFGRASYGLSGSGAWPAIEVFWPAISSATDEESPQAYVRKAKLLDGLFAADTGAIVGPFQAAALGCICDDGEADPLEGDQEYFPQWNWDRVRTWVSIRRADDYSDEQIRELAENERAFDPWLHRARIVAGGEENQGDQPQDSDTLLLEFDGALWQV